MSKITRLPAAFFLVAHGMAHLMATSVYWKLKESPDLVYQTTVLSGRLDLGETGIWIYGLLWLVTGIGTAVAGVGLGLNTRWARPLLLAATLLSLALCALVLDRAIVGAVIDVVILVGLLRQPMPAAQTAGVR
ncbi:MAG TPA: hypothetical protein VMT24_19870 [Aggregatilineaceae bacterium]|nr:hypothetical protein [Aggregatilineaceae bacterium]